MDCSKFVQNLHTFINDVPVGAFALVSSHDGLNMVLHDAHEGSVVVDLVDPVGQLRVPDQSMAAHLLAILGCKVGDLVGVTEAELSTIWLCCVPLHRILRCDAAEFRLDEVRLGVVIANRQRSTNVRATTRNHCSLKSRSLTRLKAEGRDSSCAAGQRQSGGESREQHRKETFTEQTCTSTLQGNNDLYIPPFPGTLKDS
jgi:hypothetical protein